jgi:hypothetical protein
LLASSLTVPAHVLRIVPSDIEHRSERPSGHIVKLVLGPSDLTVYPSFLGP